MSNVTLNVNVNKKNVLISRAPRLKRPKIYRTTFTYERNAQNRANETFYNKKKSRVLEKNNGIAGARTRGPLVPQPMILPADILRQNSGALVAIEGALQAKE